MDLKGFSAREGSVAVFAGKRGVGKSTTVNSLFGSAFATDPSVECTRKPQSYRIALHGGQAWRIVDLPGIAANLESAKRYNRYYRLWMSKADVVAWITQADVRAYSRDQAFFEDYSKYVRPGTRLVIGVSKADTQVTIGETKSLSLADDDVLQRKLSDVRDQIVPYSWVDSKDVILIPYSVVREWNLALLRDAVLANIKDENENGI